MFFVLSGQRELVVVVGVVFFFFLSFHPPKCMADPLNMLLVVVLSIEHFF